MYKSAAFAALISYSRANAQGLNAAAIASGVAQGPPNTLTMFAKPYLAALTLR